MLQAVPLSPHSLQHDACLLLLAVQVSNGGLPGSHHLPQLTHQVTLHITRPCSRLGRPKKKKDRRAERRGRQDGGAHEPVMRLVSVCRKTTCSQS